MKEREEEEARDARKAPRRGKAATAPSSSKAKDTVAAPPFPPPPNPTGSPATVPSSQTLVASSGKRIRIKPPAAAPPEPAPPPSTGQGMHRIPQFINNAGVPPTHQLSPGSPMSPLGSEAENHTVIDGDSLTALHNANGNSTLDTPGQLGPTSPTSLTVSAASIPSTTVRHTKPKRLKAHTVTSKSYSIPMGPDMNILSYYLTDDNFQGAISRRAIPMRRLFIIVPSMMAVMDPNSKSLQMTWQISPS